MPGQFPPAKPPYHTLPLLTVVYQNSRDFLHAIAKDCETGQKRVSYIPVVVTSDQQEHISRLKILVS